MKSLQVKYHEKNRTIEMIDDASPEVWEDVCERFDNDVSQVKEITDQEGYNRLYVCFDENNRPSHYLVEIDETLTKLRRKTFFKKLGVK